MTVVRGARIFDGERMSGAGAVAVDGARIADASAAATGGATVVDLGDVTLLPGLIDCHQHLCFDGIGELFEQVEDIDDAGLATRARESARCALRGGVTTLRDLGDRAYVTLALRGEAQLPGIVASGPPITRPGGHCWYLGGECDGERDLQRAVDERADRGCDVVKVMASGGFKTSTHPVWESQFTAAELQTVVVRAHRHGLRVASHCHGITAIEDSLNAGVDSIEHCSFMNHETRCVPPTDLLSRLATSGIVLSVTVGRKPGGTPAPALIEQNLPALRESRRRLRDLGATIVVGTDAGIGIRKPHDVLPHAMGDLLLDGMTAAEALRAMTSDAATAIGLGQRTGRLAPGFDADILAVAGDPTSDPTALTSVVAVWRAGTRIV